MTSGIHRQRAPVHRARHIAMLPATPFGWWAVGLAAASVILTAAWRAMGPLGAVPGFVCGFAGGIAALFAVLRQRERAMLVFAALVPFLFAVFFVVAELTIGHS